MKRLSTLLFVTNIFLFSHLQAGEWVSIFNGKDLTNWTPKIAGHQLGENPGRIFRVENGVLKVSYDQFDSFGDRFGHLFFNRSCSKYEFRMEYRFVGEQAADAPEWAYRNSGVMIHGQAAESMAIDKSFPASIEVQILGGNGKDERSTGNLCTPETKVMLKGQIDETHCINSTSKTYHGDQWVKLHIQVNASKEVVHFINGIEVMRYQLPQLDDGTPLESGSISLQAESHGCEFRNIEIMELD